MKSFNCEFFNLKNKEKYFYSEEAQNMSVIDRQNDANKMRAWLPFSPLNLVSISYDDFFFKENKGRELGGQPFSNWMNS